MHAASAVAGFCVALLPAAILCACFRRGIFFNNLLMPIGDALPRHSGTRSPLHMKAATVVFAAFAILDDAWAAMNPALA